MTTKENQKVTDKTDKTPDAKSSPPKPAYSLFGKGSKSGPQAGLRLAGDWADLLGGIFDEHITVARIEAKATRDGEASCFFFSHEKELARGNSAVSMDEAVAMCIAVLNGEPVTPALPEVPPVTLSPESGSHPPLGGTGTFTVTVTGQGVSGTWIVEPEATATWLTVTAPLTPQTINGSVNYNVASNTGAERVGHFYINGKTFTVTQAGV